MIDEFQYYQAIAEARRYREALEMINKKLKLQVESALLIPIKPVIEVREIVNQALEGKDG